jgi:L-amino acid N-acyltransferase YncA
VETPDVLSPAVADASVRPATAADVPAIGGIHARAWTTAYRDLIPDDVLPELTPAAMTEAWRPHLKQAGQPFHHLLVACTGPTVVGFAAFGRATDQPGAGPQDGELPTLLIDPVHVRRGHGSRLLAAGVDLMREDGAHRLFCWVPAADAPRIVFLQSAGFGQDGAWRQLTLGERQEDDRAAAEDDVEHGLREVRLVALLDAAE